MPAPGPAAPAIPARSGPFGGFALPPDKSATGVHSMPSLFVPCQSASVTVNGKALPGKPAARELAGHKFSTAMLAFSETWIRA